MCKFDLKGVTMDGSQQINPDDLYYPKPAEFRAWLQDCIVVLKISGTSMAEGANLGKNTITQFLRTPNEGTERDICLGNVHVLTCYLRGIAANQGVVLPRMAMGGVVK
jgi:hypothetical protein